MALGFPKASALHHEPQILLQTSYAAEERPDTITEERIAYQVNKFIKKKKKVSINTRQSINIHLHINITIISIQYIFDNLNVCPCILTV